MARRTLTLQWHLTDRCGRRCRHCYVQDGEGRASLSAEMDLETCREVVGMHVRLCRRLTAETGLGFEPRFVLSGGDPLLHPHLHEVLGEIARRGLETTLLGNAEGLDAAAAAALRAAGVTSFQASLDGLEATHDAIRGAGSFGATLEGFDRLAAAGVRTAVMATVHRENLEDLPALAELVARRGIGTFAFARAVALGRGRELDLDIAPLEYRAFLVGMRETERRLEGEGRATRFPRKEHLFTLLLHELGELRLVPGSRPGKTTGGCHMGGSFLVLLPDGTAMACRRFPSPIGRVPDQSLAELFLASPEMAAYRRVRDYEKCGRCELLLACRGCPAVAWGRSGSHRAPDPQCWKVVDGPPPA